MDNNIKGAAILGAFVFAVPANGASLKSFLPEHGLASYVAQHLDTHTFDSSLNPLRTSPSQTYFADFGFKPPATTEREAKFDEDEWSYTLTILKRGDFNKDGIEDVLVCFDDDAKQGSYQSQQALLLTQYTQNSPVVALAMDGDNDSCDLPKK